MFSTLLGTLAVKLLSEKVIVNVVIHILEWLTHRTTNTLDDRLLKDVASAFDVEIKEAK